MLQRSAKLEKTINPVLEAIATHLEMEQGTLTLLNQKTGEISISVAYGISVSEREKARNIFCMRSHTPLEEAS